MPQHRQPVSFIATHDPDAALAFYGGVIGLTLVEQSPFALAFSDGGHMLRVQIVKTLHPASYTVHGWQVDDIEHHIAGLRSHGVEFLQFSSLAQSDTGVWTTPDGNRIAWFNDPSGNILSLTQYTTA